MPLQLPRVRVQRQQAVAVKIVSRAPFSAVRWRWIPRCPKKLVVHRVVGSRNPRRRPSGLPRIPFPALVRWLARPGPRIEAPLPLAGIGVVAIRKTPNAILPARYSEDHP